MSAPSGLNCPDCHSALYELNDRRVLRFRCRSGHAHAFSAQSLLSGQGDRRETQLSSVFGALIERMLNDPKYFENSGLADDLSSRVEILEREAAQVCEWLHAMAGLVEPEPTLRLPAVAVTAQ